MYNIWQTATATARALKTFNSILPKNDASQRMATQHHFILHSSIDNNRNNVFLWGFYLRFWCWGSNTVTPLQSQSCTTKCLNVFALIILLLLLLSFSLVRFHFDCFANRSNFSLRHFSSIQYIVCRIFIIPLCRSVDSKPIQAPIHFWK